MTSPLPTTDCCLKLGKVKRLQNHTLKPGKPGTQISYRPRATCGLCTVVSLPREPHTSCGHLQPLSARDYMKRDKTGYPHQTPTPVCGTRLDRGQVPAPQRGWREGPAQGTRGLLHVALMNTLPAPQLVTDRRPSPQLPPPKQAKS